MEKTFEELAKEWLNPFGYSVYAYNPEKTRITFLCYEHLGEHYPAIVCSQDDDTASLSYNGLKFFISLSAQKIAFGHKDIGRYISIMRHYASICENNPPF